MRFNKKECVLIAKTLEKLFILQDRPTNDAKTTIFLEEIDTWKYDLQDILQGINTLCEYNLDRIKLHTIKEAVRCIVLARQANTPRLKEAMEFDPKISEKVNELIKSIEIKKTIIK